MIGGVGDWEMRGSFLLFCEGAGNRGIGQLKRYGQFANCPDDKLCSPPISLSPYLPILKPSPSCRKRTTESPIFR